jgi:hypothetical protein
LVKLPGKQQGTIDNPSKSLKAKMYIYINTIKKQKQVAKNSPFSLAKVHDLRNHSPKNLQLLHASIFAVKSFHYILISCSMAHIETDLYFSPRFIVLPGANRTKETG